MTLRHYILTRFNLRIWQHDKNRQDTLGEEWLSDRFARFERYCLPSVAGQTAGNFTWFVLFDRATPKPYIERINQLKLRCPQLHPIYVRPDGGMLFQLVFKQVVEREIRREAERGVKVDKVVTTYLDNDDALSLDYAETVQSIAARQPHRTYITFYYGLQYHEALNMATCVRYTYNHFNSFVEVPDAQGHVETTYTYSHTQIFRTGDCTVCRVKNRRHPMWTEVVHGHNVRNDILLRRLTLPVADRQTLRRQFGIDVCLRPHARRFFFTTFQWLTLKAYMRYFRRRIDGE